MGFDLGWSGSDPTRLKVEEDPPSWIMQCLAITLS